MRFIFFLTFAFFATTLAAQFGVVDSVGLYPFQKKWGNDFAANIAGVSGFNGGTVSHDALNNRLIIIGSSIDRGAEITAFTHTANLNYCVAINMEDIGQGAKVLAQWASPSQVLTIGWNYFLFTSPATSGAFGKEILITTANAGDTLRVGSVEIFEVVATPFFFSSNSPVKIGSNVSNTGSSSIGIGKDIGAGSNATIAIGTSVTASAAQAISIGQSATSSTNNAIAIGNSAQASGSNSTIAIGLSALSNDQRGVAIGENAKASLPESVAIGYNSEVIYNTNYGAAPGPEGVAIGETARAWGWRAVALGGNAIAGTTSATAVGAGAGAFSPHATAVGRGAYSPPAALGVIAPTVIGGDLAHDLFIANTWGHQFDLAPTGISISSYSTPWTNSTRLHGHDAFDARQTPESFNVSAGHIEIVAGRATGTGESGSVRLRVGYGNNGQNVKDTERTALEVRSEENITAGKTYVWLYDPATSTLKQVLKKEKPVQAGTNNIVGFSRLQL